MSTTLGEVKERIFKLIEEYSSTDTTDYTDDPDFKTKINSVINTIYMELFPYTKRAVVEEVDAVKGEEIDLEEEFSRFYLLKKIVGVDYSIIDKYVTWKETGTAKVYYFQYPKEITSDTDNDTKIYLDQQSVECLLYGVAADVLKLDVSNNYGSLFAQRYAELKQELDNRISQGTIKFEGGINV